MIIKPITKGYIDPLEGIKFPTDIFDSNGDIVLNNIKIVDGLNSYTLQTYVSSRNLNYLEIILKILYKEYPNKNYVCFGDAFSNIGECIANQETNNLIHNISITLKKIGSVQTIKFLTNNLSFSTNEFLYSHILFFIGKSYLKDKTQINFDKKFSHTFLYKNGNIRIHRKKLFDNLKNKILNFEDIFLWSYNALDKSAVGFKSLDGETISKKNSYKVLVVDELYNKSFCNIVSESTSKEIFITEKIDKPLLALQPFIVHGGTGYLKKLKEIGFKTFDKWWDESYDDIEDEDERINKISEQIVKISEWGLDKCQSVYAEMKDILLHNQELRNWITNNHQHQGTYSEIEYIKEKWKK